MTTCAGSWPVYWVAAEIALSPPWASTRNPTTDALQGSTAYTKFPEGCTASANGLNPVNGEPATSLRLPVLGSTEYAEIPGISLQPLWLATNKKLAAGFSATAAGQVAADVFTSPGVLSVPAWGSTANTEIELLRQLGT